MDTGLCGLKVCRGVGAVLQFELDGADLAEGGVASAAVVAVFDPGPDLEPGAGLGGPDASVLELVIQGGEERLGHGVVPAHPGASHGAGDAVGGGEGGDLG